MIYSWLKGVNEGVMVGCVSVDFRKAFYLVDHQILFKKLQCYKCNDSCLSWFESYLSKRTQRVSLNNNLSDAADVINGVPQGSILGPLLFLIFINDLPLYIQSTSTSVDLYADDTYFYCSSHDKLVLVNKLVAWSTGAQLIIFFCFRFSVVLFDRPGISIRLAAHCVCRVLVFASS